MDSANIGTIHSLCGRILRAHPAEAELDPQFSVLDDAEAAMQITQVIETAIERISTDPAFDDLLKFYSGSDLTKILIAMLKNRSRTDSAMAMPFITTEEYLREQLVLFFSNSEYEEFVEEYREMSAVPGFQKKTAAFGSHLLEFIDGYDAARVMFERWDHPGDVIVMCYSVFQDWRIVKRKDGLEVNVLQIREDLRARFPFLVEKEKREIDWYKDYWKQYDAAELGLRRLWTVVRNEYLRQMDAMQKIDFDEMETRTLVLLRSNEQIRNLWAEQIHALLVDEYQDTNDAQAELFSLLNPKHDRLFAVGDKKQSIYGFRGTNVALFDRRKEEVKASNGEEILLDTTYRTEAELLEPMGDLLEQVMADDALSGRDSGFLRCL